MQKRMRLILLFIYISLALLPAAGQPGKTLRQAEMASAAGRYVESNELLSHFMAQYPHRLYDHGQAQLLRSYNFLQQGQLAEALQANEASLALMQQFVPDALSPNYLRFGEIYLQWGQYERALHYLLLADEFPLMDEPQLAVAIQQQIGSAELGLGRYERAQAAFGNAIATAQVVMEDAGATLAALYYQLGRASFLSGDAEGAAKHYRLALQAEAANSGEAWRQGRVLNALGQAVQAAGQAAEARQYYEQARQQCAGQGGLCVAQAARALLHAARQEMRAGQLERAQALLREAQALICPHDPFQNGGSFICPDRLLAAEIQLAQAECALQAFADSRELAMLEQAWAASQRGLAAFEDEVNLLGPGLVQPALLEEHRGLYAIGLRVAALWQRETKQPAYAKQAFVLSERARAMALRLHRFGRGEGSRSQGALAQRSEQLRQALRAAEQAYTRSPWSNITGDKALNTFRASSYAYQSFLDSLREMAPAHYQEHFGFATANSAAVQRRLGPHSLLLSYYWGEEGGYVFALSSQSFDFWQLDTKPAGEPALEEMVAAFIQALQTESPAEFIQHSHALYRRLVAPAAGALKNKQHLIIVADGPLAELPFEVLISRPAKADKRLRFEKLPYLGASFQLEYRPAASWQPTRGESPEQESGLLALAPFSAGQGPVADACRFLFDTLCTASAAMLAAAPDGKYFAELPASAPELAAVAAVFSGKGEKAATLSGAEATEAAFKAQAGGYRYLHLATHGFAHGRSPAFAGIAFAHVPGGDKQEDGILFAGEIAALPLAAQLVTISHARGVAGKGARGGSWLPLGLPFLEAGAAQVLLPRWSSPRPDARQFALLYKQLLLGRAPAEALRQARLELLKDEDTAAPWHWCCLVLVGS